MLESILSPDFLAVLESLKYRELLEYANGPLIILLSAACWYSRALWSPEYGKYSEWQEIFRGERRYGMPLLVGLAFGILAEFTTPTFKPDKAIERSLTMSIGTTTLFMLANRKYGISDTRPSPNPDQTE